jgi:hypothetical protein
MAINGAAYDTRLRNALLLDPKLQRRITGDQFRSFVNLMVFVTGLVSDGVFDPQDAEMIIDADDLAALTKAGVIEACEDTGLFRFHPDYWGWQTTKLELEKIAARKAADRMRKAQSRQPEPAPEIQPEDPWGEHARNRN